VFLTKEKNGYYYVYYKNIETGKRTKKSLEVRNSNEANKLFTKFKQEYELNKSGGIKSIPISEFAEIFTNYKTNYVTREVVKSYKHMLMSLDKFLDGKINMNKLTQKHIDDYTAYLYSENYVPGGIKQSLSLLFASLRYAKKNNYLAESTNIVMPCIKVAQVEKKYLTEDELKKLLANCKNPDLIDIFLVAFMTGMRKSELINLTWRQVDLVKKGCVLDNKTSLTKTRKIRPVPLNDVIAIIKNRFKKKIGDYVFTYKSKKWDKANLYFMFKSLAKKTFGKDTDINFHTLRHSFASHLVMNGVDIFKVSKLLGHSNIAMTQIYSHLAPSNLQEAVEVLSIKNLTFNNN
jgi:integrase